MQQRVRALDLLESGHEDAAVILALDERVDRVSVRMDGRHNHGAVLVLQLSGDNVSIHISNPRYKKKSRMRKL